MAKSKSPAAQPTQPQSAPAGVESAPTSTPIIRALYRKYRPTKLSEVIGQPQVTEPLTHALESGQISHAYLFIGPRGTERLIDAVRVIAPNLPFDLRVSELETEQELMYFLDCDIEAFAVRHGVPCYGYSITLPRAGKFDADKARALAIPLPFWSRLQKGESIEHEGQLYTPDLVMGPPRRGLKITYCTDSRPTPAIAAAAQNADLFICEGMYGDDESLPKARENRHMLFSEAARLAAEAGGVRELWLTHYSPSLPNPKAYRDIARAIFPNTHTARDGWTKELRFEDE